MTIYRLYCSGDDTYKENERDYWQVGESTGIVMVVFHEKDKVPLTLVWTVTELSDREVRNYSFDFRHIIKMELGRSIDDWIKLNQRGK